MLFFEAFIAQKNNNLILLRGILDEVYKNLDVAKRSASAVESDLINKFEDKIKNG